MYLKKINLENFAKFKEFELVIDKEVTHLIGLNGSGKTTLGLTALWACLKGICENNKKGALVGNRYKFIGDEDSKAKIQIIIVDEKENAQITVTRTINKKNNKITFKAPEDYPINESWLKSLLNVHFLSSKQFCSLSGKEQAITLGIDTTSFDTKIKEHKEEAKLFRYNMKAIGELKAPEETQHISIADLIEKKDRAVAFNHEQDKLEDKINNFTEKVIAKELEVKELEEKIKLLKTQIDQGKAWINNKAESIKERIDIDAITLQINYAEENNTKALLYDEYKKKRELYDENRKKLNNTFSEVQYIEKQKLEYIKNFNFGMDGLSVDDEGKLLLNDREIRPPYFSRGELEIIVAKFFLASDPKLKLRFFDDFESLDEKNQKEILSLFLDKGFQVIIAQVGDQKKRVNDILLKEKV